MHFLPLHWLAARLTDCVLQRRSSMSTVVQKAPSGRVMLRNMCWVQRPNGRNTPNEQAKVRARVRVFVTCEYTSSASVSFSAIVWYSCGGRI